MIDETHGALDDLIDAAVTRVDRQFLVDLTVKLTDIESPTGAEREVAHFYRGVLASVGMRSFLQSIGDDRYNAVGIIEGKGSGRTLLFNGHMDTSFSNEFAERGPGFRTQGKVVDDSWIFGMGAFNMKSALAAYAGAVRAIHETGVTLCGDLIVAGVSGEIEKAPVGHFEGREYLGYGVGTKHLVTHGIVADACILGEPTNMKVVPSHCGSSWVKISIPGQLIHTAWSVHENNAIMKSRFVLEALDAWIAAYTARHASGSFRPKVNVAAVAAGNVWRGARTPDSCDIYVDVRTVPHTKSIEILREVRELIRSVNQRVENLNARVELCVSNPGAEIPDDHDLVRLVKDAHREQLGEVPETSMEVWCSDAAHMNLYDIPTVNYGSAGRIFQGGAGWSTQLGEHVHIGDLVNITKIYVRAIAKWCGVDATALH